MPSKYSLLLWIHLGHFAKRNATEFLVNQTKAVPQMNVVITNPYVHTTDVEMNAPPTRTVQIENSVALMTMTSMYATTVAMGSIASLTVIVLKKCAVKTVGFQMFLILTSCLQITYILYINMIYI